MRILIFLAMLGLAGCGVKADDTLRPQPQPTFYPWTYLGNGVARMNDGPVDCYAYYEHSISCVKVR